MSRRSLLSSMQRAQFTDFWAHMDERDLVRHFWCNEAMQQEHGIAPGEMDLYYRFLKQQYDKLQERRKAVQRLADACERKRQDLLEATREKKAVEKIEEKRKETYLRAAASRGPGFDRVQGIW